MNAERQGESYEEKTSKNKSDKDGAEKSPGNASRKPHQGKVKDTDII